MSKFTFAIPTWTPVAVADTIAMTNAGYCALVGASSTQISDLIEVYLGGQAGASSPAIMMLAHDSTIAVTPTALAAPNTIVPLKFETAALAAPVVGMVAAGTGPLRHATSKLLNLSFNAFGGIVRWVAAPGEEPNIVGNTAAGGEVSLSAFTGGTPGLLGSHIIFETH